MNHLIRIVRPGQKVTIVATGAEARVIRAEMGAFMPDDEDILGVTYRISWWDEDGRHDDWVDWHEIEWNDETVLLDVVMAGSHEDEE